MVRTENFQPPYDSTAIIQRPKLRWPKNARVALLVTPSIEVWNVMDRLAYNGPLMSPVILPPGAPDFINDSYREYGLRVGIWRLIEVFDKYKVKVSAELGVGIKESYPIVVEEGKKRKWEFIAHSYYQNDVLPVKYNDNVEAERKLIEKTVAGFRELVGRDPKGWLSPHLSYTKNTLQILAEHGFEFFCDTVNDDQPYPIHVGDKSLIAIPSTGLADSAVFARMGRSSREFVEVVKDWFDTVYKEGKKQGRIMNLTFHPYISGTPDHLAAVDSVLKYILSHEDVWSCTREEIADWYRKDYLGQS
jgi:allantoinase